MTDYLSPTGVDQKRFFNDLNHQDRDLLGEDQRAWLSNRMKAPQITWMLLGQQVLMARMHVPAPIMQERMRPGSGLSPSAFAALAIKAKTQSGPLTQQEKVWLAQVALPYNLDAWDGYPDCRSRLLDAARIHGSNLVVLTGDTHNAWASDLQDDPGRHIGVEFATPSVTSPGLEVILAGEDPKRVAQLFTQLVEPLKFAETSRRGYLQITATHEECRGDWILVDTVKQRDYTAEVAKSLRVLPGHGNRKLEPIQVGT
jgi:alkaline phosphatase D